MVNQGRWDRCVDPFPLLTISPFGVCDEGSKGGLVLGPKISFSPSCQGDQVEQPQTEQSLELGMTQEKEK